MNFQSVKASDTSIPPLSSNVSGELSALETTIHRGETALSKLDKYKPKSKLASHIRDDLRKQNLEKRATHTAQEETLKQKFIRKYSIPTESSNGVSVFKIDRQTQTWDNEDDDSSDTDVFEEVNDDERSPSDTSVSSDDNTIGTPSEEYNTPQRRRDAIAVEVAPHTTRPQAANFIDALYRNNYNFDANGTITTPNKIPIEPPINIKSLVKTLFNKRTGFPRHMTTETAQKVVWLVRDVLRFEPAHTKNWEEMKRWNINAMKEQRQSTSTQPNRRQTTALARIIRNE